MFCFVLFACISCEKSTSISVNKEKFPLENQLRKYLSDEFNTNLPDGLFFVIDNKNCGPCDQKIVEFVNKSTSEISSTLLFTDREDVSILNFKKTEMLLFLYDTLTDNKKSGKLRKYGIDAPESVVFMIDSNEIIDWGYISAKDKDKNERDRLFLRIKNFKRNK